MKQLSNLILNKLNYDAQDNIWVLDGFQGLSYSDGIKHENYLYSTINNATDLSFCSSELQDAIIDWPSEYHLSRKRSQLFEGFDFSKDIKFILEIGCGCGAITRYLGEKFPDSFIIAIEGSALRAKIARLRTKNLKNVEIIAAPFHSLQFNIKFSLIFSVGVLEYAPLFIDFASPLETSLSVLKRMLENNGTLIIGIENQFGLKYFSGAPEDHTNMVFEGIEGYPRTNGKRGRTYGRHKILQVLNNLNYGDVQLFFPFPDYKLPDLILSENAISGEKNINLGYIIGPYCQRKNDNSLYNQYLAWVELADNSLIPLFANSFLIFASTDKAKYIFNADWDFVTFSTNRRKEYQTKTLFYNIGLENSLIKKVRLFDLKYENPKVYHNLSDRKWIEGVPFSYEIARLLKKECIMLQDVIDIISPCINYLKSKCLRGDQLLDGKYIDAMSWNLIKQDRNIEYIDSEWKWKENIPIKLIITRWVYYAVQTDWRIHRNLLKSGFKNMADFIVKICSHFFPDYSMDDLLKFIELEADFIETTSLRPREKTKKDMLKMIKWKPNIFSLKF